MSGFCGSFLPTLSKPLTSGRLVPLNGHGFVIMVCSERGSELGLHRELANSVLSQFGVISGPWRAMESPNLASGFQSSSCFILYPYIKPSHRLPPSHSITTTLLLRPVILFGIGKTGRGAGAGAGDCMVKSGTGNREITCDFS